MRIGSLVFATERGLGYLAKSFYDHGVITDVAVLNHGRIPTQMGWYPEMVYITTKPWLNDELKDLCRSVDLMLFFETPFDWGIIPFCKSVGTKTAIMLMYECTPHTIPHEPDLWLAPSLLDKQYFPSSVHIPVPVEVPWKQRTTAKRFVHNAGYVGLRGRHGTLELLQAMQYVESPIELTVRAQTSELLGVVDKCPQVRGDNRVKIEVINLPYEEVWKNQDVCIDPEKFNGLSLPLQEAHASGLLVMTTDRFPSNKWLPRGPLIPVDSYLDAKVHRNFMEYREAVVNPKDIADTIDSWCGLDITDYSKLGREWAVFNSWDVLKPRYLNLFDRVIAGEER